MSTESDHTRFAVDMSRISARTSCGTAGRRVRCRLFHVQNKRKPRRCHATTVSGLTMYTAERQPLHACASHAHSIRSTDVNEGVGVGIDARRAAGVGGR